MKNLLAMVLVAAVVCWNTTASASSQIEAVPVAVEEASSPAYPDGWFRVDTDILSTQIWFGATWALSERIGLATDIYLVGTIAEFDIGLTFSAGAFSITPMAGIAFDFGTGKFASLVAPQLFTIVDAEKVYFESWIQLFFNDMMTKSKNDLVDVFYTRNFLLWKFSDHFAIGPAMELTANIRNASETGADTLDSLPVGLTTMFNYGENNTLLLFLGYETQSAENNPQLAGRFTFIRSW